MNEQAALPIDAGPPAPARIRSRVIHSDNRHTKLQLWLNGDLITGEHALVIRNQDFVYLIQKLRPEIIIVDRENTTEDLWKRIKHLPEVESL